jgi:hypothetical protein
MAFRFFRTDLDGPAGEPFAHCDWRDAVDASLYSALAAEFPIGQFSDLGGNNRVHRLGSKMLLANPETSASWRELMKYLTSQAYWNDLLDVFGAELRSRHGHLEQAAGKPFESWRASRRGEGGDVELEALAVINTSVLSKPSHVRGPHIDQAQKLWSGLLYMRAGDDDTPGGELVLRRPKGEPRFDRCFIPRALTEVVKTIPYEANHFVGFVNSTRAIHSVGLRPVTPHIRRYVDLVVELPHGTAFKVPQLNPLEWLAYRITGQHEARR